LVSAGTFTNNNDGTITWNIPAYTGIIDTHTLTIQSQIPGYNLSAKTKISLTISEIITIRSQLIKSLVDDARFVSSSAVGSWSNWHNGGYTEIDNELNTWVARTWTSGNSANSGRGIQFEFSSNVSVKYLLIYGYDIGFSGIVEYFDGTAWNTIKTFKFNDDVAEGNSLVQLNLDGAINSKLWRWQITDTYNIPSNYYLREVKMFEQLN